MVVLQILRLSDLAVLNQVCYSISLRSPLSVHRMVIVDFYIKEWIQNILNGEPGPSRDIVVANTAAALLTTRSVTSLQDGVAHASETIDSGAAKQTLEKLIAFTQATSR